jgi:Protein of unknown function (DUF3244).
MKKINSFLKHLFVLVVCIFSAQSIFAVDVPLKNGDDGTIRVGTNRVTTVTETAVTNTSISATLLIPDLYVDFSSPVGTAVISIINSTSNTVYQVAVDTYATPEVVIPVDALNSGKYTLKVSYGSTILKGTFQL